VHQTVPQDAPKEIIKGIGITSLVFGICVFIPFLGFIISLLIPIPILFYRSKLGRKNGSLVAAGTFLVISFFLGSVSFDIFFFAQLLVLGLVLGEMFERELSIEKTILYACLALWATAVATLIFASLCIRNSNHHADLEFCRKKTWNFLWFFTKKWGAPRAYPNDSGFIGSDPICPGENYSRNGHGNPACLLPGAICWWPGRFYRLQKSISPILGV
jgi:hypothetical protein